MTDTPHSFPGVSYVKTPGRSAVSDNAPVEQTVSEVLAAVRERGDEAVREYAKKFDNSALDAFEVSNAERQDALDALDPQSRADTQFAINNVRAFAEAQLTTILPLDVEPLPGVHMGHRVIPMERVGCYVPGGKFPMVASAHMSVLTANVAKVPRIVASAPPQISAASGQISPPISPKAGTAPAAPTPSCAPPDGS